MKTNTRHAIGKAVLETLEDRRLMSAVVLDHGVLTLTGSANESNVISLKYTDVQTLTARVGEQSQEFDVSRIKSVRVIGGAKGDEIELDRSLKVPTSIDGGAGNDTILSGKGNDRIDAGAGDDRVKSGKGKDIIDGGPGNDRLHGGGGKDRITAGAGNSRLFGGSGEDELIGGPGNDLLVGGKGVDKINAGGGKDDVKNRKGKDVIVGVTPAPVTAEPTPDTAIGSDDDDETLPDDGSDNGTDPSTGTGSGIVVTNPTAGSTGIVGQAAPVGKITLIADTIESGHAIHAHALESDFQGNSQLDVRYDWDFGDPDSEYNTLTGWNVAHAYENPGQYTLTLTMTDAAGRTNVTTQQITVAAETRREIHVSSGGSDLNDGFTPETAIRSFEKAASMAGDNVAILFRRGDRFDVNHLMSINGKNVVLGAYGAGDKPVLSQVNLAQRMMISVWTTASDVTIRDITFDSPYKPVNHRAEKNTTRAMTVGGSNVTVRDCVALNITDLVNSEREPDGLLVLNNDAPLTDGLRGYLVWGDGTNHVYVGNHVANSTREHAMRMNGVSHLLIAHNRLSNLDRASDQDPADICKGTIEVHKGSWAYVTSNEVWSGPLRVGPRAALTEERTSAHDYSVIENNIVHDKMIQLKPGAHHVMIRNNVVDTSIDHPAIHVHRTDYAGRATYDVTITNNTVISHTRAARLLNIEGDGSGFRVTRNLFIAPGMDYGWSGSSGVYVGNADFSALTEVSNNIWDTPDRAIGLAKGGGVHYAGPTLESGHYYTAAEWEALPQVHDEQYADVTLSDGSYQFTLNGTTAGSSIRQAA